MRFIVGLLCLCALGSAVAGKKLSPLGKKIDTVFTNACDQQQFSGSLLVANKDKIIFEKACGSANRNFTVPNGVNTRYNLGSVGKLFTAIAIAKLVEENKLTLATPVYDIIPDWLPDKKAARNITVGQLLSHASGLGTYMDDKRWQQGSDSGLYNTLKDYKPLIKEDKLLFTPGESQSYSNNAYVLLGALIEAVAHKSYPEYINRVIFQTAGMRATGFYRLDEIIPNLAVGYMQVCDNDNQNCFWKNNAYEVPFVGTPAGGAYSTLHDLWRFTKALHRQQLLNKTFTEAVLSTTIATPAADAAMKPVNIRGVSISENMTPYGFAGAWNAYGFAVWDKPLLVGHNGGGPGTSALLATAPDNKYTIIMLSNIDGAGPILFYQQLRKVLGFSETLVNF